MASDGAQLLADALTRWAGDVDDLPGTTAGRLEGLAIALRALPCPPWLATLAPAVAPAAAQPAQLAPELVHPPQQPDESDRPDIDRITGFDPTAPDFGIAITPKAAAAPAPPALAAENRAGRPRGATAAHPATVALKARAREMWITGATMTQIAAALSRSESNLWAIKKAEGWPPRRAATPPPSVPAAPIETPIDTAPPPAPPRPVAPPRARAETAETTRPGVITWLILNTSHKDRVTLSRISLPGLVAMANKARHERGLLPFAVVE